ncbi:MAG: 50S ribosomal protein L11 methyltransferase [bacterium]
MSDSSQQINENILLEILVDQEFIEIVSDALWACGAQAVEVIDNLQQSVVRTHLGNDPLGQWKAYVEQFGSEMNRLRDWPVRLFVQQIDVANTWREFAKITLVDSVALIPHWKKDEFDSSDSSLLPILIEPYGSFGMGDHPTTRATLTLALQNLQSFGDAPLILDIGCGSGVLSVALIKKFNATAHGIDLAATAIEASIFNAQLNGVEGSFTCQQGGLECISGTYTHVLANILAPVLLEGSVSIGAAVQKDGYLFLSGFTETRERDIVSCYEKIGFSLINKWEIDGWLALSLQRVSGHLLAQ